MSLTQSQSDAFSEFDLIARLTRDVRLYDGVVKGAGDDAALMDWTAGQQLVVTCDAQVEGVHFVRSFSSPEQIGRRALTVNLSDIAAMGARPRFALVSLVLPSGLDLDWLERVYAGLREQAEVFTVSIVGGNVASTSGPTCIDITVIGDVPAGTALGRDGGRDGDRVYVSGDLGTAVAGLASLRLDASKALPEAVEQVRAAYREPMPQVELGVALRTSGAVTAMIDISDGLSSDLGHICEQSGVGALIDEESLPISSATHVMAGALGASALEWALNGGDAYQLLFSVAPGREDSVAALPEKYAHHVHAIGSLSAAWRGVRLRRRDGAIVDLPPQGWDHLKGVQP
jgi:thiamine-monophosphate kinase